MRFRLPTRPDKAEWHDWFAWCPVRTLHGEYAWLERVLRKGRQTLIANGDGEPEDIWVWEYQA